MTRYWKVVVKCEGVPDRPLCVRDDMGLTVSEVETLFLAAHPEYAASPFTVKAFYYPNGVTLVSLAQEWCDTYLMARRNTGTWRASQEIQALLAALLSLDGLVQLAQQKLVKNEGVFAQIDVQDDPVLSWYMLEKINLYRYFLQELDAIKGVLL